MVQHLPPEELLLDYATGTLAEPLSLLVATHVTLSPESRRQVREFESIGGALLESVEPAEMAPGALDAALAEIDAAPDAGGDEAAGPAERPRAADASGPSGTAASVPTPLRTYVQRNFDALPWRERGSNVAEFDLLPDYPGYKTRLLRIRAGAKVPQHTHAGGEYTLVLEGSFTDETGRFARGDVAVADADVTHQPVAGSEGDCICLAVTDAPLKMTGPLGRILNYFVDM